MDFVSVYEAFLYYCCLLFIARYIMNRSPKVILLYCSFLTFIPLLLVAVWGDFDLQNVTYIGFAISQFLLIKLIFKNIKLYSIIFAYVLINCLDVIIISLLYPLIPLQFTLIDIAVNTITAMLCILACLTKIRLKIHQLLEWTPKHILVITLMLLISLTCISVLIWGAPYFSTQNVWDKTIKIVLAILQLFICIIFPILMLHSISNAHLKALTENYERQICAQAEHYRNLAAANYEARRFRHDFKNMRIAIEKLLADGEYDRALELFRECGDTLNLFRAAFDTGNGIADALLTDKQQKASACNTEILFRGAIPQDTLSPTDLCVILGNTLDNAIEACQKLPPESRKTISVSCDCSSGFLFLSIRNPTAEKVAIRDNYIATTKENKTLHGFGLYSLHRVAKKYGGEVRLTADDSGFTADIDLCISKSVCQ